MTPPPTPDSLTPAPMSLEATSAALQLSLVESLAVSNLQQQTVAMNEALILGSLHQHQLTEAAGILNLQLQVEMAARKRTEDQLRLLWDAAGVLLSTEDPDAMLHGLLAKIGPALGVDAYFSYLADESGGGLRLESCSGIPKKAQRSLRLLEAGDVFCGDVIAQRQAVHATFLQQSGDPTRGRARLLGLRSCVCKPLMFGDLLLGTLSYASRSKDEFAPDELAVLRTIAHYVAVAYERRRSTQALSVSEIRHRRLFEAASDGVLLLDPVTRKITDANPFMTTLLGYPHDQLVGKELFEIGMLKDEAASQQMFRKLQRLHEVRYEDLPLESKGGRHQDVEVVANLYQVSGRGVIQCNIRDITARKHAQDMLLRNEALFTAMIEQAPIGVYVLDSRFRLQQVNRVAAPIFQHAEAPIGTDFAQLLAGIWAPRVAAAMVRRFRHTLKTGEDYQAPELAARRLDTGVEEIHEWQIQRVTLPAGEFGVVCFSNNITARRQAELAQRELDVVNASNLRLKQEIVHRQAVEQALKKTEQEQRSMLEQSRRQQKLLRQLSHQILQTQEEERKRISRELHDVIAQTLVGINVHVAALAQEAGGGDSEFQQKIALTCDMVEKSVDVVHRFARELRPTLLDDLGLIPALNAFLKNFMEDTGIRVSLKAFAGIERAAGSVRTALFRIAQEALTNVARHAKASHVEVHLQNLTARGVIRMEIQDNGRGFKVDGKSSAKKNNRLGLLGMRERMEMIGGTFSVTSAPGQASTIQVEIPHAVAMAGDTATPPSGRSPRMARE